MSDKIYVGDIVRPKGIQSPPMLVTKLHLHNDDLEFAELLWFDASRKALQVTLSVELLEHVPIDD